MSKPATVTNHRHDAFSQRPSFQMSVWWWLAAQVFSLWPTWVWMSRRMFDGSDDPLGILAIAALAFTVWQIRHRLIQTPRLSWLFAGLAATLAATASVGTLPALLTGVISMLAIAATLLAFLPDDVARLPVIGLAILALPLLSSLQFYAGYPLRVITAEISLWLLTLFYEVQREGSTLLVNGRLIMVDAPCSGVQMAWLGYFTACVTALWWHLSNRQFLLRLPLVGILVLSGNILRNSVLVALQASHHHVADWLHQGIGLLALGLVCLGIGLLIGYRTTATPNPPAVQTETALPRPGFKSKKRPFIYHAGAAFFVLCTLWTVKTTVAQPETSGAEQSAFVEWPHQWHGNTLRPLALSEVEQRFAQGFPGAIARMTDGSRMLVFRHVTSPTRMLHPAADCYRGLGYQIKDEQLQADADNRLWRCFIAIRQGNALQVCERIEDTHGRAYTDTSAWYWSALTSSQSGPWTAITIAQPAGMGHTIPPAI